CRSHTRLGEFALADLLKAIPPFSQHLLHLALSGGCMRERAPNGRVCTSSCAGGVSTLRGPKSCRSALKTALNGPQRWIKPADFPLKLSDDRSGRRQLADCRA